MVVVAVAVGVVVVVVVGTLVTQTHLSEAHLIGENSVDPVLVATDEPVQALQLVGPHLARGRDGWDGSRLSQQHHWVFALRGVGGRG